MRQLFYGDNLSVLREHIPSESVDLIYLDPPFNSQADYNIIFKNQDATRSTAQFVAFEDSWQWGSESEQALADLIVNNGQLASFLTDFTRWLGRNSLSAYLVMMTVRLVEMHRVLKPTGSLYLHCDPTASHYLKMVLDIIFGPQNFRNEIIWKRTTAHSDAKRGFAAVSDTILFYGASQSCTFNPVRRDYDASALKRFSLNDNDGRGAYDLRDRG